ncbi:nuclear transport factor 2 family protein [Streptomyces sp. LaPpAH-108]|uniref:nuclear transport factor 2 family protein n=1 Tax=Streptomyces sp. LaPpAH-108 TaxID=1155714 RepID=UPI001319C6C8|nr:nuclear transport factor 2 family protein [Streptomyces sp. LaPpAH-108]
MSQQNAGTVAEEFWAKLQSGDREGVLAMLPDTLDWFVPGNPELVPWAGRRTSKQEIRQFLEMLGGTMKPEVNKVEQVISEGPHTVVTGYFEHRCRATGKVFASPYALRLTVKGGLVTNYDIYEDTQALVDALR